MMDNDSPDLMTIDAIKAKNPSSMPDDKDADPQAYWYDRVLFQRVQSNCILWMI